MSLCSAARRLRLTPAPARTLATAVPQPEYRRPQPTTPRPAAAAYYLAAFRALGHAPAAGPRPPALATRVLSEYTPRELYAHMHAAFLLPSSASPSLAAADTEEALLVGALRAFVRLQDYAAALVVLRALARHSHPNTKTNSRTKTSIPTPDAQALLQKAEAAVLTPIAARIAAAHPRPHRHLRFAQHLLPPRAFQAWRNADSTGMGEASPEWIAARVLEGAAPAFVLSHPPPSSGGGGRERERRAREAEEGGAAWGPVTTVLRRALCIHGALMRRTQPTGAWTDEARKRKQRKAAWEMERALVEAQPSRPKEEVRLEQDVQEAKEGPRAEL